jgi:cell surface protein SprA
MNFYKKSKFIKSALSDSRYASAPSNPISSKILMTKEEALGNKTGKERAEALKKWKDARRQERIAQRVLKANQLYNVPGPIKSFVSLLTMVQNGSLDYTENYHSRLPGYMNGVQFVDKGWNGFAPGIEYTIGYQPDSNWLNQQEKKNYLSRDPAFNMLFRQGFDQKLSARLLIEPIRSMMIDVRLDKTFTKEYSELFKDTSFDFNGPRIHSNPLSAGGFNISYIALNTFFDRHDPNVISDQFILFQNYRTIISNRVAASNGFPTNEGNYAKGYGRYAQDVLIPSFIAAYTGQDPKKVNLLNQSNTNIRSNPFSGMLPRPNWSVLYNGLTKVPLLSQLFSNISLSHGYNSNLSMNSFQSSLLFAAENRNGRSVPTFLDTVSGNYLPYFLIPNITIAERMEPLIGLNLTTLTQWSLRFEYKKSRMLSLSLVDYQLSENNSTEWVFGTSFRKRGLRLPFNIPGLNNNKLSNDLTFRLDVSLRDVFNSNSRLDQTNAYGTGGQRELTLQPSIDYVLNSKINLKFYFDQRKATPYISSSPPMTNTRAGVNIRIAL